jgi:hypothetical protein
VIPVSVYPVSQYMGVMEPKFSASVIHCGLVMAVCMMLCLSGCNTHSAPSYTWDVYPILQEKCLVCHSTPDGNGYLATGLDMTSYDSLMRGTRYGPVIVPGDSRHSIINMIVEGRIHPSPQLTRKLFPLKETEQEILRVWVETGAPDN